ncbi:hypothetical protein [Corynebacterium sputi]|uniref:hypothetical protein n=1 Tax=Corynebacterium sputi TaxID=489915 RepID=UPI0004290EF9|nr:hypothetical protein [Corynebacterium sputi]
MTDTAVHKKEDCTGVDALLHLVRGSTSVDVTVNLYCRLNGGPIGSIRSASFLTALPTGTVRPMLSRHS